ncbi:hypothetical protein C3L33_13644, partial [Rhododendron williamsianum]
MVPAMILSVEAMLERWRQHEGNEIEVYEEFRLLTSEVISRTAFGSSYLEGENMFRMLMKLGTIIARNILKIRFPGIGREEKVMRGEENNYGSDFLGSLITANHDPDERNRISVDEMVGECKFFYQAGHDTVNGVLAWSLCLLAIHTDWQEKARKEVIELFSRQNPKPEGIARLKTVRIIQLCLSSYIFL